MRVPIHAVPVIILLSICCTNKDNIIYNYIHKMKSTDSEVRLNATMDISDIDSDISPAIPILFELLNDSDIRVREFAEIAIGKAGSPAYSRLIDMLKSGDITELKHVVAILGSGYIRNNDRQKQKVFYPFLFNLLKHNNIEVRVAAAKAIELIGCLTNDCEEVCNKYIKSYNDKASVHCLNAVSIARRSPATFIPIIITKLKKASDISNIIEYIYMLKYYGKYAQPYLHEIAIYLNYKSRKVRIHAIQTILHIGPTIEIIDQLIKALSISGIRDNAAEAIGMIDDESADIAIEPLIKCIVQDDNNFLALKAIISLGKFGRKALAAVPHMRKWLENTLTYWQAKEAIEKITGEKCDAPVPKMDYPPWGHEGRPPRKLNNNSKHFTKEEIK